MRNLRIGLMLVVCVFWAGAVWADKDHKGDKDDFAPVPQTGQVISYDANVPPRDDGALQKGVELPTPRFTDKGNGTIKDNLTGLIWLKNANCVGTSYPDLGIFDGLVSWQHALDFVAGINAGTYDCGDTSGKRGTHKTDWRLPNRNELTSLLDLGTAGPALPSGHPFSNLEWGIGFYWSSTSFALNTGFAWTVDFLDGELYLVNKTTNVSYVIAVRGGSEDR